MKKIAIILALLLSCSVAYGADYAKRFPTDTPMEVYTPSNPPSVAFGDLSDYPADAVGALTNDGSGNLSWAAGGVAGDVVGPATNTDGYIPLWDGANSKTLKNGLDPSGFLTSVTAHDLLSATHGDTTASAVARGDLIVGTGASPKWDNLTKGAAGKFLTTDANDTIWSTATIPSTATGTGTILRADGTNWVATTATYPTTTTDNQILHSTSANVVGGDSKLTFDGSSLSADPDGDTVHSFGRAKIGNGFAYIPAADWATFSHYDNASLGNYALAQSSVGETHLNSASTKSITFAIGNTPKMMINDTAFQAVDIYHSDTQGLNIYSTVNSAGLLINYGGTCSIQSRPDQSTDGGFIWLNPFGGNVVIGVDNTALVFGTDYDAAISHDGSNWIFNSRNVGTGNYQFNGGEIGGDPFSDQRTYEMAGDILDNCTSPILLLGWLTPSDNGTESDLSGQGHTVTYTNTSDFTSGDQLHKGFVWSLDFDGSNDYVTVTDANDLSFGNSSTDEAFSVGMWVEVVVGNTYQDVWAKWENTGSNIEYIGLIGDDEKFYVYLADVSSGAYPWTVTNSALTAGWHYIVFTYDGAGGATAINNAKTYVDGIQVATTGTNAGSYVSMENTSAAFTVGVRSGGANWFTGDLGVIFVENTELTAAEVWASYIKTRGYYNK